MRLLGASLAVKAEVVFPTLCVGKLPHKPELRLLRGSSGSMTVPSSSPPPVIPHQADKCRCPDEPTGEVERIAPVSGPKVGVERLGERRGALQGAVHSNDPAEMVIHEFRETSLRCPNVPQRFVQYSLDLVMIEIAIGP
jgi:hypothetical protein